MKTWYTAAGLGAAVALLSGTSAHAQAQVVAAGSSAIFNAAQTGAVTDLGGSGNTTTVTGSTATITDTSTGSTVTTAGKFFLVYENTATAPGGVRRFVLDVSTDSTVGNRALFNADKISLPSATVSGLPADLQTIFNSNNGTGPAVNVSFTDIRPEDSLNATNRALAATNAFTAAGRGLGLNNGQSFKDIFGNTFPAIAFNLSSTPATTPIGAAPVVVFINATGTLSSGNDTNFANVTNVDRFTLANILNGNLIRTSDLEAISPATATPVNLTAYLREPLSGTYNTTEFCIAQSVEVNGTTPGGSTQELGVANEGSVALNEAGVSASALGSGGSTGGRVRAIGTGTEVNAVLGTPYSIGYSFYSVGNFANAGSTLKYLTVDGTDPILPAYNGGTFPAGGTGVTLTNVANGGYPIWSLLRAVTLTTPTDPSASVTGLATLLSTSIPGANNNKDFINATLLQVFRSHRAAAGLAPNNGVLAPGAELGSDVGGAVFTKTNEVDFSTDFGSGLTGRRQ